MAEHVALKKELGNSDRGLGSARYAGPEKTEIGVGRFIPWLGVTASKFYGWRERCCKVNEYNRLAFMMLEADIVAVSPARVWRVLNRARQPHQHWHIDVSYLKVCATFYYLCSILDGYTVS